MTSRDLRARACAIIMTIVASAAMTACGGGGSDPEPTKLPANLAITAPATGETAGTLQFGNSSGNTTGLKYSWTFGDGSTSTDAAPSHSYAKGGDYEVVLRVTNEAGESVEARSKVSVLNMGNVKGLVCSGASSAGWCWQQPRPSGNAIVAVHFMNDKIGLRVGDNGEIFRTVDAGKTWTQQASGTTARLQAIQFFDDKAGWVIGDYGALLRTTDGGSTWTLVKVPGADGNLPSIKVISASTLFATTYSGGTQVSVDGGASWRKLEQSPAYIADDGTLWFVADNNRVIHRSTDLGVTRTKVLDQSTVSTSYVNGGFIASGPNAGALTLRWQAYENNSYKNYVKVWSTKDGGTSWTEVVPTDATFLGAYNMPTSISSDGTMLLYAYDGKVRASSDGGMTWGEAALPAPSYYYYGYSLRALGGNMVIATQPYGTAYLSSDGGKTWSSPVLPQGVGSSYDGAPIERRADGTLVLKASVNSVNTTWHSTDAGATWTKVFTMPPQEYSYYKMLNSWFFDARKGMYIDAKGQLSETSDGGQTWAVKRSDLATNSRIQFVSATTGWLLNGAGEYNSGAGDRRLYKTTDGGATWLTSPTTDPITDYHFHNADLGWARLSYEGWRLTTDGGQSWSTLKVPGNPLTIRFFSATQMIAAGQNGLVAVTKDGGKTWTESFTGTSASLQQLTFSDANTTWAVGSSGTVLRSTDGGERWTPAALGLDNYTIYDIKFFDSKNGWFVGSNGLIMATTDGGKTWVRQVSGSSDTLLRIHAVDARTAWITGQNGSLLATATGGF